MLEPKEIIIGDKSYILHKLPAVAGYEAFVRLQSIQSVDDRKTLLGQLMAYVSVNPDGGKAEISLSSPALINNHVPDTQTLLQLENEILAYNFDFFGLGEISDCLKCAEKVAPAKNTEMLMDLLLALSKVGEQVSTN